VPLFADAADMPNEFAKARDFLQTATTVDKKQAIDKLEELKAGIPELFKTPSTGHVNYVRWRPKVEAAIQHIFPNDSKYLSGFRRIAFSATVYESATNPGINERTFSDGLEKADALLHAMIDEVKTYWSESGTSVNPKAQQTATIAALPQARDPQVVFVVHGRNEAIREAMFTFLRAIGLKPMEWSKARAATKDPNPYVGDVLHTAFTDAQAFVVVMTPDDEAWLKAEFRNEDDPIHETQLTGQARQNVLFESGMAMGYDSNRTVLVEIGALRPFSDIIGRHTVRLDNSPEKRKELAQRLQTAGCPVDLTGSDWFKAGSFELRPSPLQNRVPGAS
jgi:predicted nucleotide-binding protein